MGEILRCAPFLRQGRQNDGVTPKAKAAAKGNGGHERRLEGDAIRATLGCGAAAPDFCRG